MFFILLLTMFLYMLRQVWLSLLRLFILVYLAYWYIQCNIFSEPLRIHTLGRTKNKSSIRTSFVSAIPLSSLFYVVSLLKHCKRAEFNSRDSLTCLSHTFTLLMTTQHLKKKDQRYKI